MDRAGVDFDAGISAVDSEEVDRAGCSALALGRFDEWYGWCRLPVCSYDTLVLCLNVQRDNIPCYKQLF